MARRLLTIALTLSLTQGIALAQTPSAAPDLDCSEGFDGLRTTAMSQPGAQQAVDGDTPVITVTEPDAWKVEYSFTVPGQAAHPAVLLRTSKKQVTGVWTAQSKGCSYGDQRQFAAMMSDAKERDSDLTNASRADVERKKQDASPLAPAP